jgi:hypothetical protein
VGVFESNVDPNRGDERSRSIPIRWAPRLRKARRTASVGRLGGRSSDGVKSAQLGGVEDVALIVNPERRGTAHVKGQTIRRWRPVSIRWVVNDGPLNLVERCSKDSAK